MLKAVNQSSGVSGIDRWRGVVFIIVCICMVVVCVFLKSKAPVSPGRRGTFLCAAKEKYPKERPPYTIAPAGFTALLSR